jgi:FeS assembly SUF system protein
MDIDLVKEQIVEQIKTCYDPEIPVNIYELGLIYDIDVQPDGRTEVKMTLTSPNCPAAQSIPAEVEEKVKSVDGVTDAVIEIVWEPTWTIEMMSEDAKLEMGIDY